MGKNKSNKNKVSAKGINIVCKVFAILLIVAGTSTLIMFLIQEAKREQKIDEQTLFSKCAEQAKKFDYARLVITRHEHISDEDYTAEYVVSAAQKDTYRTYMFRDSEGNDLYQAWLKGEDTSLYDVYLFASDPDTWVKTSLEQEPVTTNMWDMFKYADGYTLMEETYPWYDTGDECYVLQMIGNTEDWEYTYEEVFIRKSDFMPMGLVFIVTSSNDLDGHTVISEDVEIDGQTYDEVDVTSKDYDTILQKYSITYSDEDQKLFDIPDEFITDEEYLESIRKSSGEE